jgi:mannose/cellobiose epimerase-like protein (N-acyl-D-glucosamine 2-epimerase family)
MCWPARSAGAFRCLRSAGDPGNRPRPARTPARIQARTAFVFAAFALPQPRLMRVLGIQARSRLEVDLTLRPAS